jgi:post-segregation antitoxin (ccd killing protein)
MKIKPFNEIRRRVSRDLRKEIRKEREEAWMAEKRKAFRVHVNDALLEKMIDEK